jgi:hypothetical protein
MWTTIGNFNRMLLNSSIDSLDRSIENSRWNNKIVDKIIDADSNDDDPDGQEDQPSATVIDRSTQSTTPKKLASHYPRSSRAQAERTFHDLLAGYHQIEKTFDIPSHDVAGAVAAFLAGSYMAYHNVDFPDQHFPPLVRQMRQVLSTSPDFARASTAQKQEMYEHLAILGMFMATTQMALKERPDPQLEASMRQAAKGYLEHFLQTDASRVQITRSGLVIR